MKSKLLDYSWEAMKIFLFIFLAVMLFTAVCENLQLDVDSSEKGLAGLLIFFMMYPYFNSNLKRIRNRP